MRWRVSVLAVVTAMGCYGSHERRSGEVRDADVLVDAGAGDAGTCAPGSACDCRAAALVPAGEHWVGVDDPFDGGGHPLYSPAHRVTLTRGAWLGIYEATAGCYARCVAAGGCAETPLTSRDFERDPRSNVQRGYWQESANAELPAAVLTWSAARAYCAWLGGRLPTNAEWEKAARGEGGRAQPWGPEPGNPREPDELGEVEQPITMCERAFYYDICRDTETLVAPVGSMPSGAGPYGHLDLIGNVVEWVADSALPYTGTDTVDPLVDVPGAPRTVRGWLHPAWHRDAVDASVAPGASEGRPFVSEPIGVRCAFDRAPEPLLTEPRGDEEP